MQRNGRGECAVAALRSAAVHRALRLRVWGRDIG